jgi:hypothetical protein
MAIKKQHLLGGLLSLAFVPAGLSQPQNLYIISTPFYAPPNVPPTIDAVNFLNLSDFELNPLAASGLGSGTIYPFATSDTVNYTNSGNMSSTTGFEFDTYSTQTKFKTSAGTVFNDVGASINCGGTNVLAIFNTNISISVLGYGAPQCLVTATNLINHGLVEMGLDSLFKFQGQNADLRNSTINMEGFESGANGLQGVYDSYWGFGNNNDWVPSGSFNFFPDTNGNLVGSILFSASFWVTNRYYNYFQTSAGVSSAKVYQNPNGFIVTNILGPSNVLYQTVFIQNSDPAISNNVFFSTDIAVEFTWPWTNVLTGQVMQDSIDLFDIHTDTTNMFLLTNGIGPMSTGLRGTFIPTNFQAGFFHGGSFSFGAGVPPLTNGSLLYPFSPGKATNDYAAYQALFRPTTVMSSPFEVANQTFSNMPGRIEIQADNQLNLTNCRIGGLNYVRLTGTNNYVPDPRTRLLTYSADFNLATTNGTLTVTNLIPPSCPRPNGTISAFSVRWTNVTVNVTAVSTNTSTNVYAVLMLNAQLQHSTPTVIQNLSLQSPNVIISDTLNVSSNLTIGALNLTIQTNGQLNLTSGQVLGTSTFPNLHNLTNYGLLTVNNGAFFQPYWNFINYGVISNQTCSIGATNFLNSGLIDGGLGSVFVSATTASLTGSPTNPGVLNAPVSSDVSLSASSISISNTFINASRKLSLIATNWLDDGGTNSGNFWSVGVGGFNLLNSPVHATLLGTTISNAAPVNANVVCAWAGQDLGASPAGYGNSNAPLGRLVLQGAAGSAFEFQPSTSTNNALYVDYIEFRDNLTTLDSSHNVANLYIDSGIKIYYAQAFLVTNDFTGGGYSIAEKINHKNNGALNWVSSYAGAFSSTTWTNTDGAVYVVNSALRNSVFIDSDGDGIANFYDPTPFFVPSRVQFGAANTKGPPQGVLLSWQTMGGATNYVFSKSRLQDPWPSFLPANAIYSNIWPYSGPATWTDTNRSSATRYYRVQVIGNHVNVFGP